MAVVIVVVAAAAVVVVVVIIIYLIRLGRMLCKVLSFLFCISVPNSWFVVNQTSRTSARVIIVHQNSYLEQLTTRHRSVIHLAQILASPHRTCDN